MASAYVGHLHASVFGLIAQYFNIALYPVFLLLLAVVMPQCPKHLQSNIKGKIKH